MIKQDNWIRAQCETPTHIYRKQLGTIEYASHPFTKEQEYWSKIQREFPTSLDVSPHEEDFFKCPSVDPITPEELNNWKPMIHPFHNKNISSDNGMRIVSKGLSSFGYDVTLADKFKIFTNINGGVIDPLKMPENCYADFEGESCIIPPNSYLLGYTVEYFHIPDDVVVVCVGKSTLARAGLQHQHESHGYPCFSQTCPSLVHLRLNEVNHCLQIRKSTDRQSHGVKVQQQQKNQHHQKDLIELFDRQFAHAIVQHASQ